MFGSEGSRKVEVKTMASMVLGVVVLKTDIIPVFIALIHASAICYGFA